MRARGFTLIELVVGMAVSLVVIAAAAMLMVASHRSFEFGKDQRDLQESGRVALQELTDHLKLAGYGMEPTLVFDVGPIANTVQDRMPVNSTARFGGYLCDDADCRDHNDAPDELVFYSRDPDFSRGVTSVSANLVVLGPSPKGEMTALQHGQILQLMCYGASSMWLQAYVTVDKVEAGTNAGETQVQLQPAVGLPFDFPTQNALLGQPCYGTAGAVRAFKIDRYRYYIQKVTDAGEMVNWTANARPYLMLDQGLADGDGQPIHTPVAADVEDLQVAYVFPLAAANQVLGDDWFGHVRVSAGNGVALDAEQFDLAPGIGIPTADTPSLDPLRTTHHPANIRAVRLAITVRSARFDPGVDDHLIPGAFNRDAISTGEVGYHRTQFETTVYVRNMETKLAIFPILDPGGPGNCAICGGG